MWKVRKTENSDCEDERRRSSVEGSYGRRRVVGRERTNG